MEAQADDAVLVMSNQPMDQELESFDYAEKQFALLVAHFGGDENWRSQARKIHDFGKAKLPKAVFDALSTSYDGVIAMYIMMINAESPKDASG